jgi:CRISPR-associated protein Cas1
MGTRGAWRTNIPERKGLFLKKEIVKSGLAVCYQQTTSPNHQGGINSMAATQTVAQRADLRNFSNFQTLQVPRHGVVTLFGYGIRIHVDRGHLVLEDGIGADRRYARLPKVDHGLRRLIIIGADGYVSLAALRWLADQDAAFVMLERNGKVLTATGPVRSSDARLRRAQALAYKSEVGLSIARELINQKLVNQEQLVRNKLINTAVADAIAEFRQELERANTMESIRLVEAMAGGAYWDAWKGFPIHFPAKDLRRTPDHWRVFESRHSPISGRARLASNPLNAMLNYCYSLLEAEARLAAAALGLDPGLGFLHFDTEARDSLACDLMEPVRPHVDALVLDWIQRETLKREWFFEQRDGTCRLMGSFATRLSEAASTWRREVAPIAEHVSHTLWVAKQKRIWPRPPATSLTQSRKREARGGGSASRAKPALKPESVCQICGESISAGRSCCRRCNIAASTERLVKAAEQGRKVALSPSVLARQSETMRRHNLARYGWDASSQPDWLNRETYLSRIQPMLHNLSASKIALALSVSVPYAIGIRSGKEQPHPRHWQTLAELVGVSSDE